MVVLCFRPIITHLSIYAVSTTHPFEDCSINLSSPLHSTCGASHIKLVKFNHLCLISNFWNLINCVFYEVGWIDQLRSAILESTSVTLLMFVGQYFHHAHFPTKKKTHSPSLLWPFSYRSSEPLPSSFLGMI